MKKNFGAKPYLFRLHTILFITVITVWAKRSAMLFQTVQSLNN